VGHARVFVAASGAIIGAAPRQPAGRANSLSAWTPHSSAKLAAHQIVGSCAAHDGVFACSGILYNHQSERQAESFVTRKITQAAAAIKLGLAERSCLAT
jgi:GDPmannose 4,6-dehydratase